MATASSRTEWTYRRIRGNAVENAKGSSEGPRDRSETATRSARECGAEGGSRRADSNFRETISQCSTRVY